MYKCIYIYIYICMYFYLCIYYIYMKIIKALHICIYKEATSFEDDYN